MNEKENYYTFLKKTHHVLQIQEFTGYVGTSSRYCIAYVPTFRKDQENVCLNKAYSQTKVFIKWDINSKTTKNFYAEEFTYAEILYQQNPNVFCRPYYCGENERTNYLMTEFIEGERLDIFVEKTKVDLTRA
ncbi:MAG: hypothetical protein LBJ67_04450 [Planctomycetaceae bacterium]|jgi:hypothetical protein|nr:hypothetical protein [Planctomycetaceae bacterium]